MKAINTSIVYLFSKSKKYFSIVIKKQVSTLLTTHYNVNCKVTYQFLGADGIIPGPGYPVALRVK